MSGNCAVLVVSCDKYKSLWSTWWKCFESQWDLRIDAEIYFATEAEDIPFMDSVLPLKVGHGAWSDRVRRSVDRLPASVSTVFFMQEDHWPVVPMERSRFNGYLRRFLKEHLLALRCCHWSPLYTIHGSFFSPKSKYLLNHQPSFWARSFLRSCLPENEDPWENEINGTVRLHASNLKNKIGFEYFPWYLHTCRRGTLTAEGLAIHQKMRAE